MAHQLSQFSSILRENESLAPFTWLQIGGPTRFLVEPNTVDEASEVLSVCHQQSIPVRLLGGGSNVLVREAGFAGATMLLSGPGFSHISQSGTLLTCGAGAKLSHVVGHAVGLGLGGLEHLIAIPGTVGGAVRGNSGSDEGDISQSIHSAKILSKDGQIRTVTRNEMAFTHRASGLDGVALIEVTFSLMESDPEVLTKRQQTFWILKRRAQPSFPERAALAFVDPVGHKAAELIHQAGMLGTVEGAVRMSTSYPNYLIASSGATSGQVLTLLDRVKQGVHDRSGVQLQQYLQIW
ncbi:MAG: FAD-binding protein [Pirellula sp.]|jgi:UDP-N-acetylmuramate dehydrogenase|nr:FAD-binding protein [Pirellula sp.]